MGSGNCEALRGEHLAGPLFLENYDLYFGKMFLNYLLIIFSPPCLCSPFFHGIILFSDIGHSGLLSTVLAFSLFSISLSTF